MRPSRRVWPALLPLLLLLIVVGATCGSSSTLALTGVASAGERARTEATRGAGPLGRVSTGDFRRTVTSEAFDGGRATVNVTPSWEGVGILGVHTSGTMFAVQRRGNASIDQSGSVTMFDYRGPEQGWIPRTIYDSKWDDRNIGGGSDSRGTIVVFFGRYDAASGRWNDMGYIRSTDDGRTFSDYQAIPTGPDRWYSPYGPLVELPGGRLMQLFYGNNGYTGRVWALFSDDDGRTWGQESVISKESYERSSEASGVVIGGTTPQNARIVVVARTEPGPNPRARGGLRQWTSADGGKTWKANGFLPVGTTASDISPWLTNLEDGRIALVWAARRTMTVEVSTADGGKAFANRRAWHRSYTLYTSRLANQRPRQAANFGYPSIAHMGATDDDAVVMFFDANYNDPSVFHERFQANTDLVMIRLLGPKIAEQRRLARLRGR